MVGVKALLFVALVQVVCAQQFCDFGKKSVLPDNVSVFNSRKVTTDIQPKAADRPHDVTQGDCSGPSDLGAKMDICVMPVIGAIHIDRNTITFEPVDGKTPTIVCVKIMDQMTDGTGGYPSIESGGVGHNTVTIVEESQRGQGMKFHVLVQAQLPE